MCGALPGLPKQSANITGLSNDGVMIAPAVCGLECIWASSCVPRVTVYAFCCITVIHACALLCYCIPSCGLAMPMLLFQSLLGRGIPFARGS